MSTEIVFLSWSHIIPRGSHDDIINQAGIKYYRDFIVTLQEAGIEPMPTLFHWDLPQALQDKCKGFLGKTEIITDFKRYAGVFFEAFGDLVYIWLGINEPNICSVLGHCICAHSPGRSSDRNKSPQGNSWIGPYIVDHNLLLAHANAVKIYREEFASQGGNIGIAVNGNWAEPYDQIEASISAAERHLTIATLWLAEPSSSVITYLIQQIR